MNPKFLSSIPVVLNAPAQDDVSATGHSRRSFLKKAGGGTIAALTAWSTLQMAAAQQNASAQSSASVAGTPAGATTYTGEFKASIPGDDVAAKLEYDSMPTSGVSASEVSVRVRINAWVQVNNPTVQYSDWIILTGKLGANDAFSHTINTTSVNADITLRLDDDGGGTHYWCELDVVRDTSVTGDAASYAGTPTICSRNFVMWYSNMDEPYDFIHDGIQYIYTGNKSSITLVPSAPTHTMTVKKIKKK
jgi:hypothetical protein